jgi:hypothetical protein
MTKLVFKSADLLRVVEHSLAAPEQRPQVVDYNDDGPVYSAADAPALLLVHDDGVYLMSNGEPGDPLDGKGEGKFFRRYVAYAQGCDPRTDGGWYDTSRDLVGGDDFSEILPWAAEIKRLIAAGERQIIIDVTGGRLELLTPSRKRKH